MKTVAWTRRVEFIRIRIGKLQEMNLPEAEYEERLQNILSILLREEIIKLENIEGRSFLTKE